MGRRGSWVPFVSPFHPFPLFLAPEKYPGRFSGTLPRKSNVKRSIRRIEKLARVRGNPLFPGFSYRTKRCPRSRSVQKGAAFSSRSKIEEEEGERDGRVHACAPRFLPRTEGEKRKGMRDACSNPLAEDSPQTRLHSSPDFPSKFLFKALLFLNLSHGLSTILSRYRSFVSFTLK